MPHYCSILFGNKIKLRNKGGTFSEIMQYEMLIAARHMQVPKRFPS